MGDDTKSCFLTLSRVNKRYCFTKAIHAMEVAPYTYVDVPTYHQVNTLPIMS
jgi:hypothetical protein